MAEIADALGADVKPCDSEQEHQVHHWYTDGVAFGDKTPIDRDKLRLCPGVDATDAEGNRVPRGDEGKPLLG